MTPVALTEAERVELRNSSTMKDLFTAKILAQCAYFTGLTSGDRIWANSRQWAAHIEKNKSVLLLDTNLMVDLEYNVLVRAWSFKDTDTVGTLEQQVIAYLDEVGQNRWAFLVDDYFADHQTLLF